MPYDKNNMFGVLADPESMKLLYTRGRAKPFEREMEAEIAKDLDNPHRHEDPAVDILLQELFGLNLDKVISCTALGGHQHQHQDENHHHSVQAAEENYEDDDEGNSHLQGDEEGDDEAVDDTSTSLHDPATVATPAPPRSAPTLTDLEPITPTTATKSGKPSHRRNRDFATLSTPPTPTTPTPPPREIFTFTSHKSYRAARALFSTTSQPDHASKLRWKDLGSLLCSPPISCQMIPARNGGASVTILRPKRGGLEKKSVVVHKPHGGVNAWCERHMLENMAVAMSGAFGWERGDFVFSEGEGEDEDGVGGEDDEN
jgi:hypothetical protein